MAIVDPAEFDRALCGLGQTHPGASAFAEDPLVRDFVILGLAAEVFGRNLPQLVPHVHCRYVSRARMGVRGLAAAGRTAPRQVLRRAAPGDLAFFPRYAENLRCHAM